MTRRQYRIREKKLAERIEVAARDLKDARGYAEVYMGRVMLGNAIRELDTLAAEVLTEKPA
jgi:hypothetical protein